MRILIVDDHELIRTALRELLHRHFPAAFFVEVGSGAQALAAVANGSFDVAIVDLFVPGETPFLYLRKLCERCPQLPVLVLSASASRIHRQQAFELGAKAFINKGAVTDTVVDAVKKLLAGTKFPATKMQQRASSSDPTNDLPELTLTELMARLTDRQLDILHRVAQGKSNKDIARECALAENTIKVHVSAILRALELNNRTQISLLAQKLELLNNGSAN